MKNKLFKQMYIGVAFIALLLTSCDKSSKNNLMMTSENEDIGASNSIDLAMTNMLIYHDSTLNAKMHSSVQLHRYDSIYHYHDSLYNHHHNKYHHGDTAHHHFGYHHTPKQHHLHDSLNNAHHHSIH